MLAGCQFEGLRIVRSYDQIPRRTIVLFLCEETQLTLDVASLLADDKGCCQAAALPDTAFLGIQAGVVGVEVEVLP